MAKITDPLSRRVAPSVSILALTVAAGLCIFASIFLGEIVGFYTLFWWWDDMLHFTSGVILGLASLLIVYSIDPKRAEVITPLFTAIFAVCFAIALGAIWEIVEFVSDIVQNGNAQRWSAPTGVSLMGRDFQGLGLRDTMSDIIYNTLGAGIAATYLYFSTKRHRSRPKV